MTGTTITGTTLTGIALTNPGANPLSIAATGILENSGAAAVAGNSSAIWTISNAGTIYAFGSTASDIGVSLAGSGIVTNVSTGTIAGLTAAISIGSQGQLTNSGLVESTSTAGSFYPIFQNTPAAVPSAAGVLMGGGAVLNLSGGLISGHQVGIDIQSAGQVTNNGSVTGQYGVLLQAGGTVTNASAAHIVGTFSGVVQLGAHYASVTNSGTITGQINGVALYGAGSVTNFGSIASTHQDVTQGSGYAGVYIKGNGQVTNTFGARIAGEWKGVAFGARPGSGTLAQSTTLSGTLNNSGYVFASNGSTAGAAVWSRANGVIINDSTGTIAGGPYAIVAYYDTTVMNAGTISGGQFAVFQANTAASDLVQVVPGAVFSGLVQGGAGGASAAVGVLELQAGPNNGTLSGFGTQFTNFGTVIVDQGASWSLAGIVTSQQTIEFQPDASLTLANPEQAQGIISGFASGDTLTLAGITGVTGATVNAQDQLVVTAGASVVATLQLGIGSTETIGAPVQFIATGSGTELIACFAEGTRIATESGERPVETLQPGMRLRSPFGGLLPIVWVGHRRTECRRHPRPQDVMPVRVQAGAFAPGLPARDLWLSPDHAVFTDGALIPVRYLLNGRSIAQFDVDTVTYWHVELASHDVLLAEGLPCESYLDTGNRAAFANGGPPMHLHPDFALRIWDERACAPLVCSGPPLAVARRALLDRAAVLGYALTADPGLVLSADGVSSAAIVSGNDWAVTVKAGMLRLRSRTWVPAQTGAGEADVRRLGVAVAALALDGAPLPLAGAAVADGWHDPEPEWRWTTGDAGLRVPRDGLLTFRLALPGTYWHDADALPDAGQVAA